MKQMKTNNSSLFKIICIAMLCCNTITMNSQFIEDSVSFSVFSDFIAYSWGDYDNDNDLDLIVVGRDESSIIQKRIYKNNGSGDFTFIDISLPSIVNQGAISWGDYDNDGDLDFLFSGAYFGTYYSRIYRNDSNDVFNNTYIYLKGLNYSSAAWGDYDSDGDIDLALSGMDASSTAHTIVYRNDGGDVFNAVEETFEGTQMGKLTWIDYDNDGDLDLMVSGYDKFYAFFSKLYRNDGNDVFNDIDISLTQGYPGWGDYNNDGYFDIVSSIDVYKNEKNDTFTDINCSLPLVLQVNTSFADMDNDGDLDIMLYGNSNLTPYEYTGGSTYVAGTNLKSDLKSGDVTWLDYNNDGRLDFFLYGTDNSYNPVIKLFQDTSGSINTTPSVPTGLHSSSKGSVATIKWNRSTDPECNQNALTYNLAIGTSSNNTDILNPSSNLQSGSRNITGWGNAGARDSFKINGLAPGKYYYRIQAIDNNFKPSAFSPLDSFIIPVFDQGEAFGFRQLIKSYLSWGDYDNDGDLDALLSGSDGADNAVTYLYRNEGNFSFTELNPGIKGVYDGYSEWGDYNNDGFLDIVICGNTKFTYPNFQPVSKLYRNDCGSGSLKFTDLNLSIQGVNEDGRLTFGDYDNDGKLDILLCGYLRLTLYHNEGNDLFTEKQIVQYSNSYYSSRFLDYDNDGDLDIIAISTFDFNTCNINLFKNNGDGTFTDSGVQLPAGYYLSEIEPGDYDNDNDLDIAVIGGYKINIYQNLGNGSFSSVFESTDSIRGSIRWGDYDNDGDLDLVASGQYTFFDQKSFLFRNEGGNSFSKDFSPLDSVSSECTFADIDNDNDLDIALTCGGNNFTNFTRLFQNNDDPNTPPLAPSVLNTNFISGTSSVILFWNKAIDNEQAGIANKGLSYNIHLVSLTTGKTIIDGMADINTGLRKIVSLGNAQSDTFFMIRNLEQGSYWWKVQAIDHSYSGSVFSVSDTFHVGLFTNDPADLTLCAGDTVSLSFSLRGMAVEADNYFVAQLSDPYGYFDVPTQIGASPGTTSGSMNIVIPKNAISGIKYKVRVFTSNPKITGKENAAFITINPRPQPEISGKPIVCQKEIGIHYSTYNSQGNTYSWNITGGTITSGSGTSKILIKWGEGTAGQVKVTETNNLGCSVTDQLNVIINPLPTAKLSNDTTICSGNSISIDPGVFFKYQWNNGATTQKLSPDETGTYWVSLTDDNGCEGISDSLTLTVLKPHAEEICIVTIDSATGKNLIAWEKTPGKRTAFYNLYREGLTAGSWEKIAMLSYSSLSVFVDTNAQPEIKSYKYRLSAVDSCGNESSMSPYHKTMLLTSSLGQEGINLYWSEYTIDGETFGFNSYIIYRGTDPAKLDSIDQIPSDNEMYPDINAPLDSIVFYRVAGLKPGTPCDPAGLLKASSGPFSQSVSNLEDNRLKEQNIQDKFLDLNFRLYPVPSDNFVTLTMELPSEITLDVKLLDMTGKIIQHLLHAKKQGRISLIIDKEELSLTPGVYQLLINTDQENFSKLIIFR